MWYLLVRWIGTEPEFLEKKEKARNADSVLFSGGGRQVISSED
jgi:hypothetical protein